MKLVLKNIILIILLSTLNLSAQNKQFDWLIEPQYYSANSFQDGLARVRKGYDNEIFINKSNETIINFKYDTLRDFHEGLAAYQLDGKWGFINTQGNRIFEIQFELSNIRNGFSEGLSHFEIEDKEDENQDNPRSFWGYIDMKGNVVIKPTFVQADAFSDNIAIVQIAGRSRFIDKKGNFLSNDTFYYLLNFKEGLAGAIKSKNGKWGYIDKTGKFVIQPQFDNVGDFTNGLAKVQLKKKWGFIDKTGKFVIQPQFDDVDGFYEGLALITKNKKTGYMDISGKIMIEPQFQNAGRFNEGVAWVIINNRYGYIKNPLNRQK